METSSTFTESFHGAAASGRRKGKGFHTTITGPLLDRWFDGKRTIHNDGFLIHSRLEWIAHIVAHELLHCLLLCMCKRSAERGGHNDEFIKLNKLLLGGHGYEWTID